MFLFKNAAMSPKLTSNRSSVMKEAYMQHIFRIETKFKNTQGKLKNRKKIDKSPIFEIWVGISLQFLDNSVRCKIQRTQRQKIIIQFIFTGKS